MLTNSKKWFEIQTLIMHSTVDRITSMVELYAYDNFFEKLNCYLIIDIINSYHKLIKFESVVAF